MNNQTTKDDCSTHTKFHQKPVIRRIILLGSLLSGTILVTAISPDGAQRQLDTTLKFLQELEPAREGPLHDQIRGAGALIHQASPTVAFVAPADEEEYAGFFAIDIENWNVEPQKAENTSTHFASGYRELGSGHTHMWVFNMDTGQQVIFTGAAAFSYSSELQAYVHVPTRVLAPGRYKAFIQLQHHDHTPPIPRSAPVFPAINSVAFVVSPSQG